jgi:hypothetical protein
LLPRLALVCVLGVMKLLVRGDVTGLFLFWLL